MGREEGLIVELEAFAAERRDRMVTADEELAPEVEKALTDWSAEGDWYDDLVESASVLWLEVFLAEAPRADPDRFMPQYQQMLAEQFALVSEPSDPPDEAQVNRLTSWLSAATINNATYEGNRAHGGRAMRWVTMMDSVVRETHRSANGQIADSEGTFDIGGYDLHYPGEPVGPPEVWMNCRCILASARVEGAFEMDTITADGTGLMPVDNSVDMPTDELEDGEQEITEIPVHGVAAVEGVPTGDGRKFALGAVQFADLPQPMGYEFESSHGGDNSKVAIIGRVDEYFKVPVGDYVEVRFRGVVFPGKPYADQAIEGILDGSGGGVSIIADSMALDMEQTGLDADQTADGQMLTQTFSQVRVRRHDIVPTPAFQEGYTLLGHEFLDEMDDDERAECESCMDRWSAEGTGAFQVVDLSSLSEAEMDAYDKMSLEEQEAYIAEHDLLLASASVFRDYSPEQRRKLAEQGKALPDGSYPIVDEEDLKNAIQAIGRASDREATIAHIKKRARDLNLTELVPEGWDAEAIAAAAFAPGTRDGPGWISHPVPSQRLRNYWTRGPGAAKIAWGAPGDFERCRSQLRKYIANPDWLAGTCANLHKEAIGVWPGQETGKHSSGSVAMNLVAAAPLDVKPAEAFKDPAFTGPHPFSVDGDRVFGHLATWGVCHIGIQDTCITAPHSNTDYGYYRTGVVNTDEGRIPVGQITMGTGHAGLRASAKDATAHYDNTGTVVADVVAGEDAFGVWVAGMLRPTVTTEQAAALAAAALSGDWRRTANGLELVAALAVNVPGFPIPRTSISASAKMGQESLVAAGVVSRETVTAGAFPSAEEIAGIVRTSVEEYRAAEVREARMNEVLPFLEKAREHSISRVTSYFQEEE